MAKEMFEASVVVDSRDQADAALLGQARLYFGDADLVINDRTIVLLPNDSDGPQFVVSASVNVRRTPPRLHAFER